MSILKFLGLDRLGSEPEATTSASGKAETATVRRIVETLDRIEPDRARYIAAFAYILSRVAHADFEISEPETRAMERVVIEQAGLPEEQAILVVQMAKTQSRLFAATENYLVTREFNRLAGREQKIGLLRCLFAVSSADESISTIEDNEVRQITEELQLEHRDFIEARSAFRNYLSVLKQEPDPPAGRDGGGDQ